MSVEFLVSKQNPDGGWPYVRGSSWMEPTVYSVLALLAAGETSSSKRGFQWILRTQRYDGSFPPKAGVDESSWVTSLVALLPPEQLGAEAHQAAIRWLLQTTGRESTRTYRLREWLLGNPSPSEHQLRGWPWIPDTAAWVGPTSLALLALDKEGRRHPTPGLGERVSEGRRFLISRVCQEGGWNHGSVRALGYESAPYPETTGMALAAMRGVRTAEVERSLAVALRFLSQCRSADALNWLRLGLLAHGELPASYCRPSEIECRTLPEASFQLLVDEVQQGCNLFWADEHGL
ncbi:MAG TPA: prenyltransferase/squalene oxidase repeat-containing protein [Bryobacteraceae bacterium]|nr:prenyltransferase/squalene oxidase repeat-containing protein [Bryobacteraceae bacterium]